MPCASRASTCARLDADVQANTDTIGGLIKRNLTIAEAIGLQGTPGFLVGPYKVNEALNYDGFQRVVADARAKQTQMILLLP